jgi:hypothetical protein
MASVGCHGNQLLHRAESLLCCTEGRVYGLSFVAALGAAFDGMLVWTTVWKPDHGRRKIFHGLLSVKARLSTKYYV